MKLDGLFKDWAIGHFRAKDKDGRSVWTGNGFMCFQDHDCETPFLRYMPFRLRWRVWRELKREMRRRQIRYIEQATNGKASDDD